MVNQRLVNHPERCVNCVVTPKTKSYRDANFVVIALMTTYEVTTGGKVNIVTFCFYL